MRSIDSFLKQYRKISPPNKTIRTATQKALEEICGIQVGIENISYKNNTIYLNIKPTERSVVLTKKQQLLDGVGGTTGKKPKDIR